MSNQSSAEHTEEEKGLPLSCCQPGRRLFTTPSIPSDLGADSAAHREDFQSVWNKGLCDSERKELLHCRVGNVGTEGAFELGQ